MRLSQLTEKTVGGFVLSMNRLYIWEKLLVLGRYIPLDDGEWGKLLILNGSQSNAWWGISSIAMSHIVS
jgi:hypothetical protein